LRVFARETAGINASRRPDRDPSNNGRGSMAREESDRSAAVLEAIQALGVAARSRTASDPWQRVLEMNRMAIITLKLTEQELALLTSLASDQLFRREFIDPKMPGNKFNPADLSLGKKLVERLRLVADRAKKAPSSKVPYAV
jgi:hypothetical protein